MANESGPTSEQQERYSTFHDEFRKRIEEDAMEFMIEQKAKKLDAFMAAIILRTSASLYMLQEENRELKERVAALEDVKRLMDGLGSVTH